jgi:hypothetical protein
VSGPSLAVGITEPNPAFVWAPRHAVPAPFDRWRDALTKLHPAYYRLVVDWSAAQPSRDATPTFAQYNGGCLRDEPPCAPYGGVREQLRALASRQRSGDGWEALVVLTGTPEWAATAPGGCERSNALPRARPPRPDALGAYRAFVAALLREAAADGARLRYWSPWNEPNQIGSLSPQRPSCDGRAPSVSVAPYARLARALHRALDAAPGDQQLVLGELAGLDKRRPLTTAVDEFVRQLPRDVACSAQLFSQHGYVGGPDLTGEALAALDAKGCPQRHAAWVTESGVGAPHAGEQRPTGAAAQARECRALHRRLERWYRDPRVTAAFQYTLREDDIFPTGLVTTDLARAYPELREWQAWGMQARPTPQAPPPADAC